MEYTLLEVFITIFCISVLIFLLYMAYIFYLKKCRGYRYKNGVPDAAILRPSSIGSAGFKHFSAASFRASQLSIDSLTRAKSAKNSGRPYTFPLASSQVSNLPQIRIEQA